jgi:hypothetical protein
MTVLKRIKFHLVAFFKNDWYVGICEFALFTSAIITGIIWWKYNKQELEPITVILAGIGGILDVVKRLIRTPKLPRLTFTEATSPSSRTSSFFMGATLTNFKDAFKTMQQENKGLFLVIYDNEHSTNSQLDYSLGYFTQYEQTKRLINQNFIQAIIPTSSADIQKYIPNDYHMENCLLIVLDKKGNIIRQEGVYANSDEGLERVRQDVAKLNKKT